MALRHRRRPDFVIVPALDLALGAGFSALTGETGAGKSILIDALQLALGGRGDALWVREGQVGHGARGLAEPEAGRREQAGRGEKAIQRK